MGLLLTRLKELAKCFEPKTESKVLMLGLDQAGKTTTLYTFKLKNESITFILTIGVNREAVTPVKGVTLDVYDFGGHPKIRPLWSHYFQSTKGLFFIVDSADSSRFEEAKDELHSIVRSPEMAHVPVVVIANKQDLSGAASTMEVADALDLNDIRDRKWHVQGACATKDVGIDEAMREMSKLIKEFRQQYS